MKTPKVLLFLAIFLIFLQANSQKVIFQKNINKLKGEYSNDLFGVNNIISQNNIITYLTLLNSEGNLIKGNIKKSNFKILKSTLSQDYLDINNISALVNSNGFLFYDLFNNSHFEVPKGSGKQSVFDSHIWINGFDDNDSLHLAGELFGNHGYDYKVGPVASNYSNSNYQIKYNRLWKINKSDVDYHVIHYNDNGYVTPETIQNWPGNGNTSNGESAILAPFMDLNGNNIYEPSLGEYPLIRGDQAIYFIFNDDTIHNSTGGNKLKFEIHGMLYSFNNLSDSALFNTVFLTYKILNRSTVNYHNLKIGIFTDIDLGYQWDDYIGCDSVLNFFYGYNSDDFDGDTNNIMYGAKPPAQGVVILNYPINNFMYFFNSSGALGAPNNNLEFYRIMNNQWKDGTPLTYGNNGYGSGAPTNFAFSGQPENINGWNEVIPNDIFGVASLGPFSLSVGDSICVDVAFPFARDYTGTNLTSLSLLRQRVQSLKTFYNSQNYYCLSVIQNVSELNNNTNTITFYPNPSEGIFTIYQKEFSNPFCIKIFNVLGKCVLVTKIYENDFPIDISQQSSGIYYYQTFDKNGNLTKGKLTIRK